MDVSFALGPAPAVPGAITFGNFDGVHLGHRALVRRLRALAAMAGGPATIVTFEPHPLRVLRPDVAPPALDSLPSRLRRLDEAGADAVIVLPFDEAMSRQPPRWFANTVLLPRARTILIGYDARFGHRGAGDVSLLRRHAADRGASVELFEAVKARGGVVSSSRIRALLEAGHVDAAAALLGRPFSLRADVVAGDRLGRTIGFPTANLGATDQVRPAAGVYAGTLVVGHDRLPAVCNLGTRPTVAGSAWRAEAHVLDFDGDLYGREVGLELFARIRGEQRFNGLDALRAQIARDCEQARALHAGQAVAHQL